MRSLGIRMQTGVVGSSRQALVPVLWGTPFLICTNQYSSKFSVDRKLATIPEHQWASKLLGHDFRVEYKPGATNIIADALSHRNTTDDGYLYVLSVPTFTLFDQLRQEINADETLRVLCMDITVGVHGDMWQVQDGLITVEGKVYVPGTSPSLYVVLVAAHGMAREGLAKMLQQVHLDFHISDAQQVVQDFV
jgi:hypothetical protein